MENKSLSSDTDTDSSALILYQSHSMAFCPCQVMRRLSSLNPPPHNKHGGGGWRAH